VLIAFSAFPVRGCGSRLNRYLAEGWGRIYVGQHVSWWRVVFGAVSAWVDGLWFWAGWLDGDGPVALGAVDDTAFVAAAGQWCRGRHVCA